MWCRESIEEEWEERNGSWEEHTRGRHPNQKVGNEEGKHFEKGKTTTKHEFRERNTGRFIKSEKMQLLPC